MRSSDEEIERLETRIHHNLQQEIINLENSGKPRNAWQYVFTSDDLKLIKEALTHYRESERLEKVYKEIVAELYGKGLSVVGWHLNGDHEPLDNLFEYNDCEWLNPLPEKDNG